MKRIRIIAFCIVMAVMLFACSGCSALVAKFEDEKTRGYTELVLDAVVDEELDTAYTIFEDFCTKDDFAPTFYEMADMLKDVESYELKLLSVNKNTNYSNGSAVTEIHSVYEMSSDDARYIVDVKTNSLVEKLSSFYVTPFEDTDYYYTGTVAKMKDANAFQWIMLLSNILIIGFTVFALIDCIRRKVKLKALWIIVIIIGFFSVGVTLSRGGINFNVNLGWLTAYTALIRYGGGTVVARIMIPVGAAAYFILRRLIIKKPAPEAPVYAPVNNGYNGYGGYNGYVPMNGYAPANEAQMPQTYVHEENSEKEQ